MADVSSVMSLGGDDLLLERLLTNCAAKYSVKTRQQQQQRKQQQQQQQQQQREEEAEAELSSRSRAVGDRKRRPDAKLIGISGKWYDITKFIAHHPGGAVIEQFVGKDATPLFKAFHGKDVLKHFVPVGTFQPAAGDPAAEAFAQLHQFFIDNGFFRTSYLWYAGKISATFALLAATLWLVLSCSAWYCHCLAGLALAAFWQQAGFLMHDFMHSQCSHERSVDRWLGTFFGTCCLGINGHWWRDEHFVHHALTNTVDYEQNFTDPQMREDIWAQNTKLFPFFTLQLQERLIRVQHWTFLPVCVFLGRTAIIVDGFRAERRWYEWAALLLHLSWLLALLAQLPTWQQALATYSIASMLEGVLHVQLLVSHYCKEFYERRHLCEETNWYRMQVESNINIANPVWMDWFHGGLNFHIEHHLFPLMPRHNFRAASRHVKAVCRQLGIHYDQCHWWTAVFRTLRHLKVMSTHFKLDPR